MSILLHARPNASNIAHKVNWVVRPGLLQFGSSIHIESGEFMRALLAIVLLLASSWGYAQGFDKSSAGNALLERLNTRSRGANG